MYTYLISYDLGGPETSNDYKRLISKIESYPTRAKPLESFRFIKTEKTIETVMTELQILIDQNDKIVVINITGDLARVTNNVGKPVIDWMIENM